MKTVRTFSDEIPFATWAAAFKFIFLSLVDFSYGKEIGNVYVLENEETLVNMSIGLFVPLYGYTPCYDFFNHNSVFNAFSKWEAVMLIRWSVRMHKDYLIQISHEDPEEFFKKNYKAYMTD